MEFGAEVFVAGSSERWDPVFIPDGEDGHVITKFIQLCSAPLSYSRKSPSFLRGSGNCCVRLWSLWNFPSCILNWSFFSFNKCPQRQVPHHRRCMAMRNHFALVDHQRPWGLWSFPTGTTCSPPALLGEMESFARALLRPCHDVRWNGMGFLGFFPSRRGTFLDGFRGGRCCQSWSWGNFVHEFILRGPEVCIGEDCLHRPSGIPTMYSIFGRRSCLFKIASLCLGEGREGAERTGRRSVVVGAETTAPSWPHGAVVAWRSWIMKHAVQGPGLSWFLR